MGTLIKLTCLAIALVPELHSIQYEVIRDNSLDINHVLYGDITKMDDMFIHPADYEGAENDEAFENTSNSRRYNIDSMKDSDDLFESIAIELLSNPFNNTGFDIHDFNTITKSLNNITRRQYVYDDPEDYYSYKEPRKKKELINAGLQFLIHTRYKLIGALKQKEPIKLSKRYRLGYLFNRLRRIQYEMSKLIDQATKQTYYTQTPSVFRFYEQTVRYQVDAKDTIELIKVIDAEPEDQITEKTLTTKSPKRPIE